MTKLLGTKTPVYVYNKLLISKDLVGEKVIANNLKR